MDVLIQCLKCHTAFMDNMEAALKGFPVYCHVCGTGFKITFTMEITEDREVDGAEGYHDDCECAVERDEIDDILEEDDIDEYNREVEEYNQGVDEWNKEVDEVCCEDCTTGDYEGFIREMVEKGIRVLDPQELREMSITSQIENIIRNMSDEELQDSFQKIRREYGE